MANVKSAEVYSPLAGRWFKTSNGQFPLTVKLTITPEWAEEVLQNRNNNNRKLQVSRAKRIAKDVAAGNFEITNQGIGFDAEGNLLDGQTRLKAVTIANKPVEMMVTFGLSKTSQEYIDDGKKRSDFDVATLRGSGLSQKAVQIGYYLLESLGGTWRPTKHERQEFYDLHQDALAFAADIMTDKREWWNKAPIGAVLARAYYHITPTQKEQLKRVGYIMKEGKCEHDTPEENILKLREWTMLHRKDATGEARLEQFYKATNAIKGLLEGKVFKQLRVLRENVFPLPEENI